MTTPLVLVAHGSPHASHAPSVLALRDAVAARLPGVHVGVGWLGFADPGVADAVRAAGRSRGRGPVREVAVVPLLLTDGYHATVDVPRELMSAPVGHQRPVLGPDPAVAAALQRRLVEAGAGDDDPVVLAAAGSSDPYARAQAAELAAHLAHLRGGRVSTAFATGPGPSVTGAVLETGSASGRPVAVATALLGPGALADRVAEQARAAGATASAPLGTAPEVVDLVVRRWAGPVAELAEPVRGAGRVA